jgi:NAD(P)-dependent dehydrogenase (short-subunit alcohol dehydrogenase family)
MLLEGRVAVVTGAGRGIGREFALALAREGAAVVVNDIGVGLRGDETGEDPAAEVCAEIKSSGGRAVPAHDSVSDYDAAGRIIQTAIDNFGQIDILVNNAGIVRDRTLVKMGPEDFDAVIATHLKGTFNCAQHAVGPMKEAGYGRIINITSSAGLRGNFGQTNYAAAKAGIMGMTFVWAMELGRSGITANAMAPAGATRMTANLYAEGEEPPATLDPSLNAPMVVYLASERASAVGPPKPWPTSSTSCWASTSSPSAWSCPAASPRTRRGRNRASPRRAPQHSALIDRASLFLARLADDQA